MSRIDNQRSPNLCEKRKKKKKRKRIINEGVNTNIGCSLYLGAAISASYFIEKAKRKGHEMEVQLPF